MAFGRLLFVAGLVLGSSTSVFGGLGISLKTERVAAGFDLPLFVTHRAGDYDNLFVLEKEGGIRIVDRETGSHSLFMDIDSFVGGGTSFNDERGLLGMAWHPDWQTNRLFYVYYTNNSNDATIASFEHVMGDPDLGNSGSIQVMMIIDQPQTNHNGGWIGFGPNDDYLYIGTGDGGNFCDTGTGHVTGGNAQDITNNLLGKLLRIDVDGNNGPGGFYGIPADNPFVGITGDDEIWSYGLRNPWRCSFDRANGDIYIGDVGQDAREEISYSRGTSTGGENYGWRCTEGNTCSSASGCSTTGCTCNGPTLIPPIHTYSHSGGICSVTGGYVYRGCAIDGLQGAYWFADVCSNNVWTFEYDGVSVTNFQATTASALSPPGFSIGSIVSFGEDAYGELYIVDHNSELYRVLADFSLDPAADCNENGIHDDCELLDGSLVDDNGNMIPDACEIPPCKSVADCADADDNGSRDDACVFYECIASECVESARASQADIGGENGACGLDTACDANDRFHALNCFQNQDTQGNSPYNCEAAPPSSLNVDAGGPESCTLDGTCDGNDAFHALNCFENDWFDGSAGYQCGCSGPAPTAPMHKPAPRQQAGVRLSAPPLVRAGQEIAVEVFLQDGLEALRGYQLHVGVTGGTRGGMELKDVVVDARRKDYVFAGVPGVWSAFNRNTGQILVGMDAAEGRPATADGYLATFVFEVPKDAAGTFAVDLQYETPGIETPSGRTFFFGRSARLVDVPSITPARLTVVNERPRERASR